MNPLILCMQMIMIQSICIHLDLGCGFKSNPSLISIGQERWMTVKLQSVYGVISLVHLLLKNGKKSKITKRNIIEDETSRHTTQPYIDVSITNNAAVKASQFRLSLYKNRIFEVDIAMDIDRHARQSRTRGSIDHSIDHKDEINNTNACKQQQKKKGINLLNTVINDDTLRVVCCILWHPQLAHDVLRQFVDNASFNVDGRHKTDPEKETDSLSISTSAYYEECSSSVGSSPIAPSVASLGRFSNISTNTSYTGAYGHLDASIDMEFEEIHRYLMCMDYSDKKNPVKYEWKLIVNALNAFQFKVISIDDYTDNDILNMVNQIREGLMNSIADQRSGLIKVACHLFVLLAQYRTPLFFDEEFFKLWMICLLRKCANRDRIRTLPAHNACSDIVACCVSFYVNNKDYSTHILLSKLRHIFVIFCGLWTPDNVDHLWMKQEKSVTQFIKNISLMIRHIALILHDEDECELMNDDIQEMQRIAFHLFEQFIKQSHKEVRQCALQLLNQLYKLEKDKTFEFAKEHFKSDREFTDYLNKLKQDTVLKEEHQTYLESIAHKTNKKTKTNCQKKEEEEEKGKKEQKRD
eukprot:524335_1